MKRLLALICVLALLAGCTPAAPVETDPVPPSETVTAPPADPPTDPEETLQTDPPETSEPVQTDPEETTADPDTFTVALHAAVSIFDGPGYDFLYERCVGQDGVYTITEVAEDDEHNQWGRLKSGLGWVDLTALTAPLPPVTVSLDDGGSTDTEGAHTVAADDSEYGVRLIFRAAEPVTDVRFSILDYAGSSYTEFETYCTLPQLAPSRPLVASVVFYGDMTAYGIAFTDAAGEARHFAVTVSGRNGALEFHEYTP